jgi:hypothetical protein
VLGVAAFRRCRLTSKPRAAPRPFELERKLRQRAVLADVSASSKSATVAASLADSVLGAVTPLLPRGHEESDAGGRRFRGVLADLRGNDRPVKERHAYRLQRESQ